MLLSRGNEPLARGIKIWRGESTGGTFPGGGGMSKFLVSGRGTPPTPSRENPVVPLLKKVSKILNPQFG